MIDTFPSLTTERLSLEPVIASDQGFIYEGLSHPQVIPFFGVSYTSLEATEAQMNWYEKMYREGTGISWKIVSKENGDRLGVISVYYYKPEHQKAEIGFWLLPEAWNQGFASEAIKAVIHYWKSVKSLHRMEAFVEEGNTSSSRLLEKNGFRLEGMMKDCEKKEGRFISLLVYALLLD